MLHIRQICVDDNGRVTCISLSDIFEINKVKEEKDVERVNRLLKNSIVSDADIEAILTLKIEHKDAAIIYELLKESEKEQPPDDELKELTERELEVHHLIGEGLTEQEISKALNITVSAVKGHTQNIFSKLQIHSRSKIIVKALKKD